MVQQTLTTPEAHRRHQLSSSSPEVFKSHDSPTIELPSAKKPRLSMGISTQSTAEFRAGAILKIRMRNFMTYDDISYDFGPALNMIIGPNGSGKSTVVAGICLGLGFDPKIMGRADKVEATIKHGTQTATIDIELQGAKGENNTRISRVFGHGSNGGKGQNDWHLNGKRTTHKTIQEVVRRFNCQIDNLCQFLPQDKVASFARMKPVEMLAATLRTVGDGSLGLTHAELSELQSKLFAESTTRKTEEDRLKGLKARQEVLERDVARFKERESIQHEMFIRQKRLPFARYNEAKAAHTEAKNVYNEAKANLLHFRTDHQSLEAQENDLNTAVAKALKSANRFKQRLDADTKQLENSARPLARFEDAMTTLEGNFKHEREAERNNKRRIVELRERVAKDSRALGEEPETDRRTEELLQELRKLNAADREERNERDDLEQYLRNQKSERTRREDDIQNKEKQLSALEDVRSHRFQLLRSKNRDAADAVEWLQANQDKFEHRVYDPVLLEVQVVDKRYAKAAQHVIMQNAFTFTCQSRKDYQTFNNLLVDNKSAGRRLRLNVVEWSRTSAPKLRDQRSLLTSDEVKELGLDGGYLLDCLDGPEPVLNTLCHAAQVHNLPIGTRELSQAQISAIESATKNNRPAFQRYIVNNTDTKIFRGYGQTSSESQAMHNDGSVFSHIVDVAKKKQLEHDIEEIRDSINESVAEQNKKKSRWEELKSNLQAVDAEKRKLNEERSALQRTKTTWRAAKAKLEQSQKELDRLESAPAEYGDNMAAIRAEQLATTKKHTQLVLQYKEEIKAAEDAYEKHIVAAAAHLQAVANKSAFEQHNSAVQAELRDAELAMQRGKKLKDDAYAHAHACHAEATAAVADLTEEEKDVISNYDTNTSVEDLEIEIENCRSRLGLLATTDGNVVDNYEARARDIEALEELLAQKDAVLKELQDDIDAHKADFESRLETMRVDIDRSFGEAFRSIDCLGEIRLGKPEQFAEWTLEIWVQFRDTDSLQMLTGERQSGGERSVSTIFYLMALQSLSIAPFRVVDEINQGMDPKNERRVHARMVEVACAVHTSQYFLITPKLLSDLAYHPNMKVHCVTSGNLGRSGNRIGYSKYLAALRARKSATQQQQAESQRLVY